MVRSIPMIAAADVEAASIWYQTLLKCKSGHGGREYEKLVSDGAAILQIHQLDQDHPDLGSPKNCPVGMVLWFEVSDFDLAVSKAAQLNAKVLEPVHLNTFANHREFWIQDMDGYRVVLASTYGDIADAVPRIVE